MRRRRRARCKSDAVEKLYIEKCSDLGIKVRRRNLREFRRLHRRARVFIGTAVELVNEDTCPLMVQELPGGLYYFVKVVDSTVYPAILTREELVQLGYGDVPGDRR